MKWFKKNWYIFLIGASSLAVLAIVVIFRGKSNNKLVSAFVKNRDGYLEQIEKIEQLQEEEREQKVLALSAHEERLHTTDDELAEALKTLAEEAEKWKEMAAKMSSEELADSLEEEFEL